MGIISLNTCFAQNAFTEISHVQSSENIIYFMIFCSSSICFAVPSLLFCSFSTCVHDPLPLYLLSGTHFYQKLTIFSLFQPTLSVLILYPSNFSLSIFQALYFAVLGYIFKIFLICLHILLTSLSGSVGISVVWHMVI